MTDKHGEQGQHVYVVIATNKWPDDGFDLFGAFRTRRAAEEHAATQPANPGKETWDNYSVQELELRD